MSALIHQPVKIFHEGLFWRCSFLAASHEYSVWDLWIGEDLHCALLTATQTFFDTVVPPQWSSRYQSCARLRSSSHFLSKAHYGWSHMMPPMNAPLRLVGILPSRSLNHRQHLTEGVRCASVFRTFWSIFLISGVAAVIIGGFVVICAAPLTNHRLYKVGGALQLCGGKITSP